MKVLRKMAQETKFAPVGNKMQLVWLTLVPVAVFVSYFYRIYSSIFNNGTSLNSVKSDGLTSDAFDLWGTYRSNLLFGMRTKTPQALMTGLSWNAIDTVRGFTKIRHSCDLDDQIKFGWTEHDGRTYGVEEIVDKFHKTQLKVSFLKATSPLFPSRESWTVKIKNKPIEDSESRAFSLLFYLAYDGDTSMKLKPFKTAKFDGFTGWTAESGHFVIGIIPSTIGNSERKLNVFHDQVERSQVWELMEKVSMTMKGKLQQAYYAIGNRIFESDLREFAVIDFEASKSAGIEASNVLGLQLITTNDDDDFEVFYFPVDPKMDSEAQVSAHMKIMTEKVKEAKKKEFDRKVIEKFNLKSKDNRPLLPFVKYCLSNLLGGISYFYGDSQVFSSDGTVEKTAETSLFTDVPARANFPRGFYWDSGFHNLVIGKWDWKLSLEILTNWVDKIDEDGWVGREQILGAEARSKVPSEFITQNPKYSNPPAALLPIEMLASLISMPSSDDSAVKEIKATLRQMYPKLVRHFKWFLRTQRGVLVGSDGEDAFVFRWRGRSSHHTLTSGLDDYPRGEVPSEYELHVDLLSWMAFSARSLGKLKRILEIEEMNDPDFDGLYVEALNNLNAHHWDESRGCYSDLTVNEDDDGLEFVRHVGYVSLFPMLFGLIVPGDEKLERLFDILEDPMQLWTRYGIRSLSKSDSFYERGDKYWTGPIWLNLNYLILSSLKKYYMTSPRARDIYAKLRQNLIDNLHGEWERTGHIWEQYSDRTGRGQRSRPFSGWTSLIVLIIAEDYH